MADIKLVGDSCCDLTTELRQKYDIDYVRMSVLIDGVEMPASLDWEYFSPSEFYGYMNDGKKITTAQVTREEYESKFRKYLSQGKDVIYIGCSGALSGSVSFAELIAPEIAADYPGRKLIVIDALNACMGQGILLLKAAELIELGKNTDEVAETIRNLRCMVNQIGTVNSLDALRRAGRVKASKAFFGNMFGVKPIIISDAKGQNTPIKKVKGRTASVNEIYSLMADAITEPEKQVVYVGHAACSEEANELADKIKNGYGCKDVYIFDIGPIIGSSVGPSMLVLYAFGKKVEYIAEE